MEKNNNTIVDVWILNAGKISPTFERTNDGLESTMQINFLSHQLLIDKVLKKGKKQMLSTTTTTTAAATTTIVALSSYGQLDMLI